MLLRDNASYASLVASDQLTSKEKFIGRVWAVHRTEENAESPGFIKDRNMSSPRGGC